MLPSPQILREWAGAAAALPCAAGVHLLCGGSFDMLRLRRRQYKSVAILCGRFVEDKRSRSSSVDPYLHE